MSEQSEDKERILALEKIVKDQAKDIKSLRKSFDLLVSMISQVIEDDSEDEGSQGPQGPQQGPVMSDFYN